ncbi:S1 family peptidase [Nocardia sp.]|uniref:S1 family peptidase n=1 Tax=Nocardia sp. TaxID=1821 RepID=UPI00262B7D66|nr:S1 family peptidase [Nocardia sp.]
MSTPAVGSAGREAVPDAGLPAALRTAVGRDLGLPPLEYLRRADLAQRLGSFAAEQNRQSPGALSGIRLDADGQGVVSVAPGHDDVRIAARQAGFLSADADVAQWDPRADRIDQRLSGLSDAADLGESAGGDGYIAIARPEGAPLVSNQKGSLCSWAFNGVAGDGSSVALTAGHCNLLALADEPNISDQKAYQLLSGRKLGEFLGSFERSVVDGIRDYSIVRLDDAARNSFDNNLVRGPVGAAAIAVTGVGVPVVGAPVCKSGVTTGFTCGVITAVDQPDPLRPPIRFQHTALALPGDSGGALISGTLAMGLVSEGGVSSEPGFSDDKPGVLGTPGSPTLPIDLGRILQQIGPERLEQIAPFIAQLLPLVPQVTMTAQSAADILAENPGLRIRTS